MPTINGCLKCGFIFSRPKRGCHNCSTKLWKDALNNMPWMAEVKYKYINVAPGVRIMSNYRRGQATALRLCLGYTVYSPKGRSNAQMAVYNAIKRGSIPLAPKRQSLLAALAGPSGAILARVRLTQINQASRFRYWP